MANTYTLISSSVLTSSAASVTFSSIPGTYTDLVLRCSVRSTNSGLTWMKLTFNSSGGTDYSQTFIMGTGIAASSNRDSSAADIQNPFYTVGSNATSNTFSNGEIYIPNYAGSTNKPLSISNVTEQNSASTNTRISAQAVLWRNISAITSITLADDSLDFVSGSSFYLYGIKNS